MNAPKPHANSRVADLELSTCASSVATELTEANHLQLIQTLRTTKTPTSLGSFIERHEKATSLKQSNDVEEDHTEVTQSETEISESWHSRGSAAKPRLRVAPHHQALHEEEDDDDGAKKISLQDLQYHRMLGEGFFGQVWLVSSSNKDENESSNQKRCWHALKKLSKYHLLCEHQVENTVREKQILQQLRHPGIVKLVASCQDDSSLYLLQEFCQGGELFSLLHRPGHAAGLPEAHCQFYAACLADALWYMHCQARAVYRDLKPENVLLDAAGYPVLVDFGYAKILEEDDDEKTYTMCGTPKYLPPEMIQGGGHTFSVDYWSLGVIVYEMLCGEHPFEFWKGQDDLSLYGSIAEADYLELPEDAVSAAAADWVARVLVKDPEKRLGSDERADSNGILQHAWLCGQNVPALRRKLVPAPWIPALQDGNDASHFDFVPEDQGDSNLSGDHDPPLTMKEQARFADF